MPWPSPTFTQRSFGFMREPLHRKEPCPRVSVRLLPEDEYGDLRIGRHRDAPQNSLLISALHPLCDLTEWWWHRDSCFVPQS